MGNIRPPRTEPDKSLLEPAKPQPPATGLVKRWAIDNNGDEYEHPNGRFMLAEDVYELHGEVVSTLETIIALVPDVGDLSKVKWLLAQLRGGGA